MGEKRIKNWWLIKIALTIAGGKILRVMRKASKDTKKAQSQTLRHILTGAKDTVYGKKYHFEEILKAKTPEELFISYQKNVPVIEYEDIRSYVERHKNGEPDILFPGKPKMYSTTSGTTKEPKWIPVTEEYYNNVYKEMTRAWFYTMILNKPKVFYGPGVSIVGKAIEGKAPDGTVYGSVSGVTQRDIPGFMKALHTAPTDVSHIADYKSRYYAIMRMGIERDAYLLITANPSTLIEIQANANEYFEDYCDDIERGTVSEKFPMPEEVRAALIAYTKPNPARAEELRKLKKQHGTIKFKHFWPNMQLVNIWFCGNTYIYLEKIRGSFPDGCVFNEFGYFSSECRTGLPLKSNTQDTVLFCHKSYFEFIHENDMENPNPRIYQTHEVKTGQRYVMLVTTCSGLYRYNMNDLLEITGRYNDFPMLKFVQKINGIISLTGEKLHEKQFIDAVHETVKKTGRNVSFYVGFADLEKSNYQFYYEFENQNTTMAEAGEFTNCLDQVLQEYNNEYKDKRASNRLKAPDTSLLAPKAFDRFKLACLDGGYRDGQFKLNLLMQDETRHRMFKDLVKK